MNASEVNAGIVVASAASPGLVLNTHYKSLANMGDACPAGRYGLLMAPFKLCPLCPAGAAHAMVARQECAGGCACPSLSVAYQAPTCAAALLTPTAPGTTGDGYGCEPAAAGTFVRGVGSTAVTGSCAAGTYSVSGSSMCLPCPAHSYSDDGAASCIQW